MHIASNQEKADVAAQTQAGTIELGVARRISDTLLKLGLTVNGQTQEFYIRVGAAASLVSRIAGALSDPSPIDPLPQAEPATDTDAQPGPDFSDVGRAVVEAQQQTYNLLLSLGVPEDEAYARAQSAEIVVAGEDVDVFVRY